ncbi:MAG: DUF3987 domain-containing protein [Bacteroidaceae bacterium]|nr:DUF3987 domain-containing protein [Bacteroidaceae bacterium]
MADLVKIAYAEMCTKHPDFMECEERVREMLSLSYSDLSRSASMLYHDDMEKWQRYIINGYKEILLREYDREQPHFPLSMYGSFAPGIAEEIATAYGVSPDMIAAAMFAAVGAAAGNKFKVVHGNFINPLSMWWCLVAPSGYGKTEPLAPILQPLHDINKQLIAQTKAAFSSWKQNGQQGERPRKRQLIINDTTPEARDELLADNPEGLLIYRDELAGLFNDIGRYNNSGEVENYLSIWSGKGYSVNRKTSEPLYIQNPILTIFGGIQPEIIANVFRSRGMMVNGFFARWSFVCPTIFAQRTFNALAIDNTIVEYWREFIEALHDEDTQPRTFTLNDEASSIHDRFFARIADELSDERSTSREREVLAKLRVMVFRLAGLIHLLKYGISAPSLIDAETMGAAVLSVEAIKAWNFKALNLIEGDSRQMTQKELVRAIRAQWPSMNVSQFCDAVSLSRDTFNYYFR